ncbi:MAG: hypothetical protein HKP58_14345 [Desulfatitalea sp.]|nr:hypothetical protein [Desulfatitalea sp.]NNK01585.1 hypothetical protein [Desulfatitalea sp.]
MSDVIARAYPRVSFEAPIQYGVSNAGTCLQLHAARTLNYSAGGFCYETDEQLPPEAEVCIIMSNYTPGQNGPESFRSYLTRLRWMQPLPVTQEKRYAAGAQIIARSHDVLDICAEEPRHDCDLCGALTALPRLQKIAGDAQLCGSCFRHFQSFPQGKGRQCLERFLMGNVV